MAKEFILLSKDRYEEMIKTLDNNNQNISKEKNNDAEERQRVEEKSIPYSTNEPRESTPAPTHTVPPIKSKREERFKLPPGKPIHERKTRRTVKKTFDPKDWITY